MLRNFSEILMIYDFCVYLAVDLICKARDGAEILWTVIELSAH